MSLLDDLFVRTAPPELALADDAVTADAEIAAGYFYQVEGSGDPIELTLPPLALAEAAGKRIAIKMMDGSGELLTITMPEGLEIEGDDGTYSGSAELAQIAGNYREWLCSNAGKWMLVSWVTREFG